MSSPFPAEHKELADSMGISLYQRFAPTEASLFLRCPVQDVTKMIRSGQINCIQITDKQFEFFGYQLLEYLMDSVTHNALAPSSDNGSTTDSILGAKEVQRLTSLSRTTIWRKENDGTFPRRVSLGAGRVGWLTSAVNEWIQGR